MEHPESDGERAPACRRQCNRQRLLVQSELNTLKSSRSATARGRRIGAAIEKGTACSSMIALLNGEQCFRHGQCKLVRCKVAAATTPWRNSQRSPPSDSSRIAV